MKGLALVLIIVVASLLVGCAAPPVPAVQNALAAPPAATPVEPTMQPTAAPIAQAEPTRVYWQVVWPLGREFDDTATVEGKYGLDFGGGVKVAIENRSHAKITLDEPTLYYYLTFLGTCPNLPKLIVVDGMRDAEIMMEKDGPIVVVGSDRASLNIGLTSACLATASGYPEKTLREISIQNWDRAVHLTAVLLGMTYDEYVTLAKTHKANAVECGPDDCGGYKALAADLYASDIRHAPIQSQKP